MAINVTRRTALKGLTALAGSVFGEALAEPQIAAIDELQPGDFVWHPERAPAGPVAIVVSIPDQRVYVYRNGVRIGVSTCSTGKPGHETPTGVFTILEKDKHHRSSTYANAPMPNMNRLTWSGIALHAGKLPGYPASHGCVRLPMAFSERVFQITQVGTPVIIADAATYPTTVLHPGMVLSGEAQAALQVAPPSKKRPPAKTAAPATSVLISSADSRIILLQDGQIAASGHATIAEPERPLGSHVYVLSHAEGEKGQLVWRTIGYHDGGERGLQLTPTDTLYRIRGEPAVIAEMSKRMAPGMIMVTVDLPLSADTRTGRDFVIMTDQAVS